MNPLSSRKGFEPTRIIIILFAVLVIASFVFQVVRLALSDGD
nr:putative membrane protein [Ipomoea batatas]